MLFEARPVRVEAVQWDGSPEGARAIAESGFIQVERVSKSRGLIVVDPDSYWLTVAPGCWIVRCGSDLFEIMPPEQFAERYAPVEP